ncbi:Dabb family protein [Sphaerotilus mobilis]|nr:Dabb family protein [Sphaerotilus mobilis]
MRSFAPRTTATMEPIMFIHSAMFWLRPDLTPAERALFDAEVRQLARLPYLEQGHVGTPAATPQRPPLTDHSFDYATSLHFRTMADHDHYQNACPLHAHFVATCKGYWTRVVVHDIAPLD